ncbi:nucleotide sugar dehydrogenase [Candidatus Uhrbacteria bacterium]|nr:nucleotide sugar dehydrogenase [Candidatus Uhrbacteria bacterium]
MESETIAVVGLGYVGLPLAAAFARAGFPVVGFDVNAERVSALSHGHDGTGEVDDAVLAVLREERRITFTTATLPLSEASVVIITVPTPITDAKVPDLSAIEMAADFIGPRLRSGAVVVLESTVYPGVTEEVLVPRIERTSGKRCGVDWFVGYSPERINPGDRQHTIDTVVKIIAGMDGATTERLASVYGAICAAGVHRAPSIMAAEAAKVFENIQRDLGIAAVNELALICARLRIPTADVLAAARTKWNFVDYRPGLVGGHCIGVDPHYLAHRAQELGYHPEVILAGRRVNEAMAGHVADLMLEGLIAAGKLVKESRVLILGLTFKANVPDTRNSKVRDVIARLRRFHVDVVAHDPLLNHTEAMNGFGVRNIAEARQLEPVDGIVVATLHDAFRGLSAAAFHDLLRKPGVVVDVSSHFAAQLSGHPDIAYRSL